MQIGTRISREDISRRLKAIREELRLEKRELAARLGVERTRYSNWESDAVSSLPAEQAMVSLCDLLPGLTLDYIYRGRLVGVPPGLAIRLTARELGDNPDAPDFQSDRAAAAMVRGLA